MHVESISQLLKANGCIVFHGTEYKCTQHPSTFYSSKKKFRTIHYFFLLFAIMHYSVVQILLYIYGFVYTEKKMQKWMLTIFTCRRSGHCGVIYWVVSCHLLGNQGHHCIIRYLQNRCTHHERTPQTQSCLFWGFHFSRLLTQARRSIHHCVGVIFCIHFHLFWFCVSKHRMCYYPYVLCSAHTSLPWMTGGTESLAKHCRGLCEMGRLTGSIQ